MGVFLESLMELRPRAAHCPEETVGEELNASILEYFREVTRSTRHLATCPPLLASSILSAVDEEYGHMQRVQSDKFVMPFDDWEILYLIYVSSAMEVDG